jgi:hypothetical protein
MSTQTYTLTHSATYLTDRMLTAFKDVLRDMGLDPSQLAGDWPTLERGIKTWLGTSDLRSLDLDVYDPTTDRLVSRNKFTIDYSAGGDEFWEDGDAIRAQIKKAGPIPSKCRYTIVADTKPGRPDVPGWSKCTQRSADGLVPHAGGSAVMAPGLSANASYWRKP